MKLAGLTYMTTLPLVKGAKSIDAKDLNIKRRNPTIEDFHFPDGLPTADELPCSDGMPVDSELQELMPGLLKAILIDIWGDRKGWLFGIDMAFYYDPARPHVGIAPDGMLSLGVADAPTENLRSSFVLWQEKVIPLFAVEIVSKTAGGEKTKKFEIYQSVGILYYLVYAPLLKRKAKFQLYKLIEGKYVLQSSGQQPYWMPEIGLAIGAEQRVYGGIEREWLYWYDENDVRCLTPMEKVEMEARRADIEAQKAQFEAQRANSESQRAESELAARLLAEQRVNDLLEQMRKLGVDPDAIASLAPEVIAGDSID
jgi:Uma2 family endonuclease